MKEYNKDNISRAKELRKNMTPWEQKLWYQFLRGYSHRFQRQKCIGNYIVDFYCAKANLAIELDGGGHYEPGQTEYDRYRSDYLENLKIKVIRVCNLDIDRYFESVCEYIDREVNCSLPPALRATSLTEGGNCIHHSKETTMKTVTIYTDGACSGNPGPGGWGAILMYGGHKKELSGGERQTTNNRMELTGVIRALQALKEPCIVELWSDSKYVIDALEKGWAVGWRARGWKKADKKPALNTDLWEVLLDLAEMHQLRYHWVKGHAENEYNNRCDQMAVAERERFA